MEIAAFVIMTLITLTGIAYPLWKPQEAPGVIFAPGPIVDLEAGRQNMLCRNCGRALQEDEQFCPQCGAPAGDRCSNCGRILEGDELFCPGCGARIGTDNG